MLLVNIVYAAKKAYKCEKIRYDLAVSSNLLKKLDLPAAEKLAGFFLPKAVAVFYLKLREFLPNAGGIFYLKLRFFLQKAGGHYLKQRRYFLPKEDVVFNLKLREFFAKIRTKKFDR